MGNCLPRDESPLTDYRLPATDSKVVFESKLAVDRSLSRSQFLDVNVESKLSELFSQSPEVMSGAVVFKGTRIPVQTFFDHLHQGGTIDQFLEWYEGITRGQLEAEQRIAQRIVALLAGELEIENGVILSGDYEAGDARIGCHEELRLAIKKNGELLSLAEAAGFDVLVTTDQNLRYQINLQNRKLAAFILSRGNWPQISPCAAEVASKIKAIRKPELYICTIPPSA